MEDFFINRVNGGRCVVGVHGGVRHLWIIEKDRRDVDKVDIDSLRLDFTCIYA
jgi:hypothetical protein